jgi:uncharacterized protein YraI
MVILQASARLHSTVIKRKVLISETHSCDHSFGFVGFSISTSGIWIRKVSTNTVFQFYFTPHLVLCTEIQILHNDVDALQVL